MPLKLSIIRYFILLGLILSFGFSQTSENTIYLTLDSSISRALQDNNQLQSSYFGVKKARWDRYRAWSQFLPTAYLSSRYMHIDDQTLRERDFRSYMPPELRDQIPQTVFQESYYTAIDVSMPLFNGVLLNGLRIANAGKNIAAKMNESTKNNILFQVINSYLGVLKTEESLRIQQEFLNNSVLKYEKAQRQQTAGRFSDNEVLFWKIDYQQQQTALTNTQSGLRTTKTILSNLIDIDVNADIVIENSIPKMLSNETDKFERMSDEQILNLIKLSENELVKVNAALAAAQSQTKMSKLLYKNTYASYMPNISLNYTHAWRENNTIELDDYSPKTMMLNFSLPLFTSFQNFANTKSSYYEYRQNEENYQDQLDNIRFVVSETANKIINLKSQCALSQINADYFKNNFIIIEQQHKRGLVSDIDYTDAKLNLQNIELNNVSNQYDFISAIVELYYLLGKLDQIANAN